MHVQHENVATSKYNLVYLFVFCQEWKEDIKRKETVSGWKKDKEEERLARERVKQQIAQDRYYELYTPFPTVMFSVLHGRAVT